MARLTDAQVNAELKRLRKERLARYRADPLVADVRWVCVGDGRSCDGCKALHDDVISLTDERWPKLLCLHAGCRCRFAWSLGAKSEGEKEA